MVTVLLWDVRFKGKLQSLPQSPHPLLVLDLQCALTQLKSDELSAEALCRGLSVADHKVRSPVTNSDQKPLLERGAEGILNRSADSKKVQRTSDKRKTCWALHDDGKPAGYHLAFHTLNKVLKSKYLNL